MNTLPLNPSQAAPAAAADAHLDMSALLGADAWARLPAAVRRRFGPHAAATTYRGRMDLRCSPLGRVIAWLAWPLRGPLVPHTLRAVPVDVNVAPDGRGGVLWSRQLGGQMVMSTKSAHPQGGVLERTRGGLAMALDATEEDGALVLTSRHYAWCSGALYLRLPRWLVPGVCRVEHRDLGAGRFRFTMTMTHPLWGVTFAQTGVFTDPHEEN